MQRIYVSNANLEVHMKWSVSLCHNQLIINYSVTKYFLTGCISHNKKTNFQSKDVEHKSVSINQKSEMGAY